MDFQSFQVPWPLTVFNLPQMTRNVEDSLKHVHHTQREAGLALGISRWETVVHVVIPEALPGIVTGVVLASGRIFGEAAALIYTAGQSAPALDWSNWNILSVTSPISIFRQAETLAVHIWKVNSEGTIQMELSYQQVLRPCSSSLSSSLTLELANSEATYIRN